MEELKQRMATLKQEMVEEGKRYFQEESGAVFEKFPGLEQFAWTQYTPYWCDGDVCEFSVHGSDWLQEVIFNGEELDEVSRPSARGYYDYTQRKYVDRDPENPNYSEEEQLALALTDLVRAVPEDVMQDMFGDHVKVTVTRNGIDVTEYEHE